MGIVAKMFGLGIIGALVYGAFHVGRYTMTEDYQHKVAPAVQLIGNEVKDDCSSLAGKIKEIYHQYRPGHESGTEQKADEPRMQRGGHDRR